MSRYEVGAGTVAAGTALVAAVLYVPVLRFLDILYTGLPRTTELYFFLYFGLIFYALILAPLVALIAGTVVWRCVVSPSSSPTRGAIASVASAVVTMLLVPLLFSLLILAREYIRAAWWTPETYQIFISTSQLLVVVTYGGLLYWSLRAGVILMPLSVIAGWTYQRRHQHRKL
ncbi:hypothetical protein ABNG03_10955 [Halorubrum sp. RMP-47]|uniref:Uncharacterized protein n=1 Tax=Halorubrum miltondacostae TaxID=3076378 RepID=A0ABD5M3Z9_9EURY